MIKNVIVDLSHWNENINFKLAKEDGILVVIHKATQGLGYIDPTYAKRRKAAEEEGILWGSYHFAQGKTAKIKLIIFWKQLAIVLKFYLP